MFKKDGSTRQQSGGTTTHARPAEPPVGARQTWKRRPKRQTAFKRGTLILESGARMSVAVVNYTEHGVRVDFDRGASGITRTVTLLEATLNIRRRARVIWRNQYSAGLSFFGDPV